MSNQHYELERGMDQAIAKASAAEEKLAVRESKQLWYVSVGRVLWVQAWRCTPQNPNYWYIPSDGCSCALGVDLFEQEDDALLRAIEYNNAVLERHRFLLEKNRKRLLEITEISHPESAE